MTDKAKIKELAAMLKQSERTCVAIPAISASNPDLTIPDAYAIQLTNIDLELSEGKKITGKKIGLTSLAMQNLLGVDQPDFGHLLDSMEVQNHQIKRDTMVAPRVEGEIAFILKEDIHGPNATVEDVLNATDYVVPALEIVDSRLANWKINIIDTVSDNASSGMYELGTQKTDPKKVDLKQVSMAFYKNGEKVNEGKGTDVLGDPAYCVAWLANVLHDYGVVLKKGEVVLSGALSAMQAGEAGDSFKAVFSELGEVEMKFV